MKFSPEVKYRVGVIGCGRAGTGRARAFDLHPLCAVAAIADTDADNLALGCERFGVPGYNTWEEMFASEEIDIAMPVLPVRPNADAVVASAEAGGEGHLLRETSHQQPDRCRPHGRGVQLPRGSHRLRRHGLQPPRLPEGVRAGRLRGDRRGTPHQPLREQRPGGLPRLEPGAQVRRQNAGRDGHWSRRGGSFQRLRGAVRGG
ncbi:MAG TPA: hypothetical protein EYM39_06845 [Candidatus Latescibacteria bacterium]|nr:hypothetical protein [Candidatus Latescibacterota bacterium]